MRTRLFRRSLVVVGVLVVAVASGATVGATVHQSKVPTSALACVNAKGSLVLASGTGCAAGLRTIHIPLSTKRGPRGARGLRGLAGTQGSAGAQGVTGPHGSTGATGPDVSTTFTGQVNGVSSIFTWATPEGFASESTTGPPTSRPCSQMRC